MNYAPIESLGHINVNSGKSKYFNIYDTWEGMTCEIWQATNGQYKLVFSAGPIGKDGDRQTFKANQTGRKLFDGNFIESFPIEDLKSKAKGVLAVQLVWDNNKIMGYTYK